MDQSRNTQEALLQYLKKNAAATGPELAEALGVTRQTISHHTQKLLAQRKIVKTGSTRSARYYPADAAPKGRKLQRDLDIHGLDESRVYEDFAIALNYGRLRENVEAIMHYAFTEMLNNAIDHSKSRQCRVEAEINASRLKFSIRDYGIGVYHSIVKTFGLEDEHAAMIELIKGKTTTQPEAHSGEGIFFTSRSADRFVLRSHRIQLEWDQSADDVFVSDTKFLKGTLVQFDIGLNSRRQLEKVFEKFAPGEYDFRFEKTQVFVRLLQKAYISRSEAKRLLHNLDRFSEIELDMKGVKSTGQGFIDEVFRVFANRHPGVKIRATNTATTVAAMIRHVGS